MHLAPPRAEAGRRVDILDHHDGGAGAGLDIAVIGEALGGLILVVGAGRLGRAHPRRARIADHRRQGGKGAMQMAHSEAAGAALGTNNFQRIADCGCIPLG